MAINPGSDILSDALIAANPQRAEAAAGRLAALAAADGSDLPPFDAVLAAEPQAAQAVAAKLPVTALGVENQALRSGKRDNPYEQFEAVMLKSFFELMLPEHADSVFGSGFAGGVWKSMFAQSLAQAAGHGKITRLARDLEANAKRTKS